jgi:hypothetical protein
MDMNKLCQAFIGFSLVFFSACTANQTLHLAKDGSGTAQFKVDIKQLFVDFLSDDDAKKGSEKAPFFDGQKIKKSLERRPGFTVKKAVAPTPQSLEVEASFKDIRKLFPDVGTAGSIVNISDKNGQTTVTFHIEKKNARHIAELFADAASNPALKEMSPRKQKATTEKEYLDAIKFAVGNEGPPLMKSSFLDFRIEVEGELISQTGGTIENGAAVFHIPILSILILEKPLDYSVTFSAARKTGQK